MNIKNKLLETRSAIYDFFGVGSAAEASPATNYDATQYTDYRTLTSWTNIINGFTGRNVLDDAYVRSIVHCIASYATKLKMQHRIKQDDGRYDVLQDDITYLLNQRPNKYMSAAAFNYKVFAQLLVSNNAFVYPQYSEAGTLVALWPISFDLAELKQDENGSLYVLFRLLGSAIIVPYEQMIHIRNQFSQNDILGDDQSTALNSIIDRSAVLSQARENILKANGTVQAVLKANANLDQADLDKIVSDFVNSYGRKNHIAAIDNKVDITAVPSQLVNVSNEDIAQGKKDILDYFGISEEILSGNYTEAQLEAFFASKIQPLAVQIGEEIQYKLLSDGRINRGHEIVYNINTLQCASIQTRADLCERLVTIGLMSANEGREIMGLPMRDEVEAAELRVSLNTVSLQQARQYQLGKAGVTAIAENNGGNNDGK